MTTLRALRERLDASPIGIDLDETWRGRLLNHDLFLALCAALKAMEDQTAAARPAGTSSGVREGSVPPAAAPTAHPDSPRAGLQPVDAEPAPDKPREGGE